MPPQAIFFDKGNNNGYRIRVTGTNYIQVLDRGGTNSLTSSNALPLGQWVHVAMSANATGLKIYLNGTLSGSTGTAYGSPNTSSVLYLGRYGTGNERFNGNLDDARIYNRALSANEILAIYQQGF